MSSFLPSSEERFLDAFGKIGCAVLSLLAVAAMCGMVGCATTPKTPAQSVYALKGGFAVALKAALVYESLPACAPSGPPVCSEAAVKAKILVSATQADKAIAVAEDAVRKGALDPQTLSDAQAALYGFEGLASSLKVK